MTHAARFTVNGPLNPAAVALARSSRDAYLASEHDVLEAHDDVLFNAVIVALQGFLAALDPSGTGTAVQVSVETGCSDPVHLTPYVYMTKSWRQSSTGPNHHWRTTMSGVTAADQTLATAQMASVLVSQGRAVEAGDSSVLNAVFAGITSWVAALVPTTAIRADIDASVSDGNLSMVSASLSITTAQPAAAAPNPLAGVLTPPAITGTANNYNPTGLAGASDLRLSSTATATITGIAGGSGTRELRIYNVGASNITLAANNTGSTVGSRILASGNLLLNPNEGAILVYDPVALGWRIVGAFL